MDICQPIFIKTKNDEKYFLLIIEDGELKKNNDPQPYYYGYNWENQSPKLIFFKSPEDAFKHAMKLFPQQKEITQITSMTMNNFLSEQDLKHIN